MGLSPEIRRRIYDEERIRLEARERLSEELRLRKQDTAFLIRALALVAVFALSYLVSDHYLKRAQAVPEIPTQTPATAPLIGQVVLGEIEQVLKPKDEATVCVKAIGRERQQIKATIELARDLPRSVSRRLAMDKAREVGAALRRHGFAIPAYVEVFSPKRWYGVALYDSDTLKISWDTCPGRCTEEGTEQVRRCRP